MNLRSKVKHALAATGAYRARLQIQPYPGAAVLAYHGVRRDDLPPGSMPFETLHVRASALDEHCRVLKELCTPVTLARWREVASARDTMPPRAALVTFDDGYRSVLTEALPILERHGIPAAVFVCTDPVEQRRRFWFDAIAQRDGEAAVDRAKQLPYASWRALVDDAFLAASDADPCAPLSIAELQRLAAHPLIEIGAHTASHPVLARAPREVQQDEVARCLDSLKTWLGRDVKSFAYPNGRPREDYNEETMAVLTEWGIEDAFAVQQAFAGIDRGRLEQPRFLMLDSVTGAELAHRLAVSWPRQAVVA